MTPTQLVAGAQAATFIGTGVWPLVSIRSFEAVTGHKRDKWLVQSMGALITAVGCALANGSRRAVRGETALLGAAAAATLAACDVFFVAKRRIPKVYLLDAVLEGAFVASWLAFWPRQRASSRVPCMTAARSLS